MMVRNYKGFLNNYDTLRGTLAVGLKSSEFQVEIRRGIFAFKLAEEIYFHG